jgi:hypothetical protein
MAQLNTRLHIVAMDGEFQGDIKVSDRISIGVRSHCRQAKDVGDQHALTQRHGFSQAGSENFGRTRVREPEGILR